MIDQVVQASDVVVETNRFLIEPLNIIHIPYENMLLIMNNLKYSKKNLNRKEILCILISMFSNIGFSLERILGKFIGSVVVIRDWKNAHVNSIFMNVPDPVTWSHNAVTGCR